MLSPFTLRSLVALAMLGVLSLSIAQDEEKKPALTAEEAELAQKEADDQALMEELDENFPIGRTIFGVRIPQYDGDALTRLIRAKKMRRVDDSHLDMEDLNITVFNDVGEPETFIEMERAVYDSVDERLVSRTPTRIFHPEKYEIKGDSMVYDTKTKVMTMKRSRERQVETTLYESGGVLPGASFMVDDDGVEEPLIVTPTPLSPSSI